MKVTIREGLLKKVSEITLSEDENGLTIDLKNGAEREYVVDDKKLAAFVQTAETQKLEVPFDKSKTDKV